MISIDHVTKVFDERAVAVQNVNVRIQSGAVTGVLGPNGAGKTTLLKMIAGFLSPTSGTICLDGNELSPENINKLRLRMGYVPEEPILYEKLTGREFLQFISNLYINAKYPVASEDLIRRMSLNGQIDRLIEEYSHGMKRKLSLLAAMIHDPDVLILDEPTNGLDPRAIRNLKDLLRDRKNRAKITLLSTHILDMAEYLCEVVLILDKGVLLFNGTLEELRTSRELPKAKLEDLFLEMTEQEIGNGK